MLHHNESFNQRDLMKKRNLFFGILFLLFGLKLIFGSKQDEHRNNTSFH